jgi:hypothetical protein
MGLFHKKDKNLSPSGFFTAEMTPSDEKDERTAMRSSHDDAKRASTSSATSTERTPAAAAATREQQQHPGAGPATVSPTSNEVKPNLHDAEVAGESATSTTHHQGSHDDKVLAREAEQDRLDKDRSNHSGAGAGTAAGGAALAGAAAAATASSHHHGNRDHEGESTRGQSLAGAERSHTSEGAQSGLANVKEAAMPPHGHHAQPAADAALSPEDAALAEHDHKYLQPVVRESARLSSPYASSSETQHSDD